MNREQSMGVVTSNDDPAKGGAIKVAMPSMGGEEYPEWADPIHPACLFFHPEVGDTVELDIPEGEDITEFSEEVRFRGIVTGETGAYPDDFQENFPHRRGFQTKEGHTLILDDKTKDMLLRSAKGHEINLWADGTIDIHQADSSTRITIEPGGKITLDAPETDLNEAATDYLVKGTAFKAAFASMVPALNPAQTMALVNDILLVLKTNLPLSTVTRTA